MSIKPIWNPSKNLVAQSNLTSFQNYINKKYNTNFQAYDDFHKWSINSLNQFWSSLIEYEEIIYKGSLRPHVDGDMRMPGTKWYPNMKLNFAQNLLKFNNDSIAIESHSEAGEIVKISFKELNQKVDTLCLLKVSWSDLWRSRCICYPKYFRNYSIDVSHNQIRCNMDLMLSDFGEEAILDRFEQVSPKVLIVTDGYSFKGKYFSIKDKIINVVSKINSLESIITIDYINDCEVNDNRAQRYRDLEKKSVSKISDYDVFDFNHPLYIMYSSGTTGKPKSIVHSSGGTLIQHVKELSLHTNIKREIRFFYYTTCGWMMWNWLVSALSLGATIVLYDGNPFFPNERRLLELASKSRINVFGTSAKYIDSLRLSGCKPNDEFNFDLLSSILSTGSPLAEENFEFVYNHWKKKNVQLSSISGGTDIISCFALGNPNLPVYKGELQCLGLGMNVKSYDDSGNSIISEKGELVCETPFPSMPIFFWNDKDDAKYHEAYFSKFKEKWTHGDYISINKLGGIRIFGRSDATLNPGGVRIGTSEIYKVVDQIDGVLDSVAISKNFNGDDKILLFVKMSKEFNNETITLIKQRLREECSPKHVPYKVFKIDDIPYTLNGKKNRISYKEK